MISESILITLTIMAIAVFLVLYEYKSVECAGGCTGDCNQGRKPCDCRGK